MYVERVLGGREGESSAVADRRAAPQDALAVLALLGQTWPNFANPQPSLVDTWRQRLEMDDRLAWMAFGANDELAAVVVVRTLPSCELIGNISADAEVCFLVVAAEARTQGHGSRLEVMALRHLAALGRQVAYGAVELSRPDSITFWRSRGWIDGPEYHRGDAHVLTMTKPLDVDGLAASGDTKVEPLNAASVRKGAHGPPSR
jgi:GNAT superfamily N-acetyltransferase